MNRTSIRIASLMASVLVGATVLGLASSGAASGRQPTHGRIPEEAFDGNQLDQGRVPDFVEVADVPDGFVRRGDLFPQPVNGVSTPPSESITVYDRVGNVIGHLMADRGFVPLGADPSEVPATPPTTIQK